MLKPADGIEGVKDAILTAVRDAGPNACPPMVVGVGIGGTFEKCALMAKEALTREAGSHSEIPYVKDLEEELLEKINGLGIGPGDPELMTLKAVRLIRENDTIAVPGEKPEESIAYQIAVQAVPELAEKELVAIPMPMTKNAKELEENHRRGAEKIEELLDAGKNVVFLTLGDPTVYSTYLYVHRRVLEDGYDARIVSGVTSFCAAAASLSEGLVENSEELHVIPASYQIEDALELSGTKVLMKAGKKMPAVKQFLKEKNCRAVMVENCGMDTEQKYFSAEEIPDQASYYSLIIVKEKRKK